MITHIAFWKTSNTVSKWVLRIQYNNAYSYIYYQLDDQTKKIISTSVHNFLDNSILDMFANIVGTSIIGESLSELKNRIQTYRLVYLQD